MQPLIYKIISYSPPEGGKKEGVLDLEAASPYTHCINTIFAPPFDTEAMSVSIELPFQREGEEFPAGLYVGAHVQLIPLAQGQKKGGNKQLEFTFSPKEAE